MKVLVTGATGFIGRHLLSRLKETGHHMKALVRQGVNRSFVPSWLHDGTVDVTLGDVTNVVDVKNAVRDVDIVFHLAALLGKWRVSESEYYRVNVHGTQVLIHECLKFGVNHFVLLSTTGVMGRLKSIPADIDHPCSPTSYYERSKYQAELVVRDAISRKNLPATIIRSAHTYGVGDKDFVRLFKSIKRLRFFPLIGGGHNSFQPIYVEDVVRALITCMEKRELTVGKSYIIAGSEKVTFKEFLILSASIMNIALTTFDVPTRLARMMAYGSETIGNIVGRDPLLTNSLVEFFTRNYLYDIGRIREDIGFTPRIRIKAGLLDTIRWYEKNDWL